MYFFRRFSPPFIVVLSNFNTTIVINESKYIGYDVKIVRFQKYFFDFY